MIRKILPLALLALAVPVAADAAVKDYDALKSAGYKTSKLSETRGGVPGWYVTKGDDRFFCPSGYGYAYGPGGKGGIFSGDEFFAVLPQYFVQLKAFADARGETIPKLSDVLAGRPPSHMVKRCSTAI